MAADDQLPMRVIDISATIGSHTGGIHFVAPSDWSFHVISHPWSAVFRQISDHVDTISYNTYRENADLREWQGYNQLIELFTLLAKAGVKYAWFYPFCINETDNIEKSRETGNVAAYFRNSRGCYVLLHSLGEGYSFTAGHMPRWFNRVWTLQEFVLPDRLTFLTELSQRVQIIIRGLIIKTNSGCSGFCRCCIAKDVFRQLPPGGHRWQDRVTFLRSCGIDLDVHHIDEFTVHDDVFPQLISNDSEIIASTVDDQYPSTCPTCGTPPLVRRCPGRMLQHSGATSNSPTSGDGQIYMVEKEAYLFLHYLESFFPLNHDYPATSRILHLNRSLGQMWDPWRVVNEIGRRDCILEEDRVIGTLGLLLGGSRTMQVTVGQSLEAQIVHLAKYCQSADADLLLKMCMVEQPGGCQPGMSWAPTSSLLGKHLLNDGDVCDLSFGQRAAFHLFQHRPGECCRHLVPGTDVLLPKLLDLSNLRASMAHSASQLHRLSHLKRQVNFLDCSLHGITLEAQVLAAHVMPYAMLPPQGQAAVKEVMLQAAAVSNVTPSEEEHAESLRLRMWKADGGVIESSAEHTPTHCMYFKEAGIFLPLFVTLYWAQTGPDNNFQPMLTMADAVRPWNMLHLNLEKNKGARAALVGARGHHRLEEERIRIQMEVCLLWMGTVDSYDVAMVCLARKTAPKEEQIVAELHKIGLFVLPSNYIFESGCAASKRRYLLGGFGEDATTDMFVSCAIADIVISRNPE